MRRHFLVVGLALALAPIAARAQQNISTVAGGGPTGLAPLSSSIGIPVGLAEDSSGNLYIADAHANRVYESLTTGTLVVFAGNGGQGYAGDTALAVNAQLSAPTGVFVDSSGNVFIADSGNNVIREVAVATGNITTVAGTGAAGYSGDTGAATSAKLSNPNGVYVDGAGDIFIADSANNVIREVVSGTINTVAGTGAAGFTGDTGAATAAKLNNPLDVYLDGAGDIFIADHNNNVVREVLAADHTIHTYAGSSSGTAGITGDGGLATSAFLNGPSGIFVDSSNNVFIADTNNSIVREVTPLNGKIQTVAGNGINGFSGDGSPAKFAELSLPRGVFLDTTGNILISDTGNSFVRAVGAGTGDIVLIAGDGTIGFSGDGSLAIDAALNLPSGVAADGSGDIFVADSMNNVVREVLVSTGLIQTVAGRVTAGSSGNGGLATNALLNGPAGVFVDGFGDLFIADTKNNVIREVVAVSGSVQGANIQTVAGNGSAGFSGDGNFAAQAQLSSPSGVFVDGSGNIFIADTANNRIREVIKSTGDIQTIAGNGTAGYGGDGGLATGSGVMLSGPQGVFVDLFGNIFIADTGNNVVREVVSSTGKIQTFAGDFALGAGYSGNNGSPTSAQLNGPAAVMEDAAGDLFIADTKNNVIREVASGSGSIQTVVGNNVAGFGGDGGAALSASLHSPNGLSLDNLGGIEIADAANNRVRDVSGLVAIPSITLSATGLNFNNQVIGSISVAQTVKLTNTGAAILQIVNVGFTGANSASFAQTNNCGTSLAPNGGFCTISVTFAPPTGGPLSANLAITDSGPGSPQNIALTGTGVSPVTLAPSGLSYTIQVNGTSSMPQSIVLTNNQAVSLNIIGAGIAITGANSASFSQANTCGTAVSAAGTCTITVTFDPTITGSNSAILTVNDDAPGNAQSATLFGLGTAATATLSPTTLTFGTQASDTTSAAQTVTVTNNGKQSLNISNIVYGGTNSPSFSTSANTCDIQIVAGANCTISVTFTPVTGGAQTASLEFFDSAADSPQSVTLNGTGLDFQITVPSGSPITNTVTAGSSVGYAIQVDAVGGATSTDTIIVKLTCGNVPQGVTCTVSQNSVTVSPDISAQVTVNVSTTAAKTSGAVWRILKPQWMGPIAVFYILGMLALLAWFLGRQSTRALFGRRCPRWATAAFVVIFIGGTAGLLTSCGGGGTAVATGPTGTTTAGSYSLVVSGAAGNDTHQVVLGLTVQ